MAQFNGQLNANAVLNVGVLQSSIFNMIISQDIIGGSIKNNYNLVSRGLADAGLYGDTKLYYDSPNLTPVTWVQDDEEFLDVLKLHRPKAPKVQKLVIDTYKQVALTKDSVLSKQAFASEGAFTSYIGVIESRLNKAKEVYLNKMYNTFIGITKGYNAAGTEVKLEVNTAAGNNSTGENIAYAVQTLIDNIKDYSTEFTKNGFERAFGDEDINIIWNNKYKNAVLAIDAPSIFHNERIERTFDGDKLPARFFGDVNDHTTSVAGDRATHDLYLTTTTTGDTYVAAGDLIPAGLTITAGDAYTENSKIIAKVYTKLPPLLQAFSVASDFYNARNLSTNMYVTWGHSTLETLDSEVCLTIYDTAE